MRRRNQNTGEYVIDDLNSTSQAKATADLATPNFANIKTPHTRKTEIKGSLAARRGLQDITNKTPAHAGSSLKQNLFKNSPSAYAPISSNAGKSIVNPTVLPDKLLKSSPKPVKKSNLKNENKFEEEFDDIFEDFNELSSDADGFELSFDRAKSLPASSNQKESIIADDELDVEYMPPQKTEDQVDIDDRYKLDALALQKLKRFPISYAAGPFETTKDFLESLSSEDSIEQSISDLEYIEDSGELFDGDLGEFQSPKAVNHTTAKACSNSPDFSPSFQ